MWKEEEEWESEKKEKPIMFYCGPKRAIERERRHVKRRDRIERCDRDWTVTSSRVYVCVVSV